MAAPRIAIIGGGPGGLTLLNVLARHNIAATLYERDVEFQTRAHLGGSLDLHEDSGLRAIKAAGPAVYAGFLKHSRPEADEKLVTNRTGVPLLHYKPPPGVERPARPEIDRTTLRKVLLDGAPQDSIKWGHAFVSASPVAGSAEWEVSFANGFKTTVDLVVGADGGRSRVRPLVSDAHIQHTGFEGVEVSFSAEVAAAHPDLRARMGDGAVCAVDEGKMIGAGRTSEGRVQATYWFPEKEGWALPSDPTAAKAEILAHFDGWAPWLRQFAELADPQAIYPRSLYMLPVGHSWPHRPGVTLLGDAMNLMTPLAGRGANIAMYAGLELGLAISETPHNLDAAVVKYEQNVRALVVESTTETERNLKTVMGPNAAQGMVAAFKRAFAMGSDQSTEEGQ